MSSDILEEESIVVIPSPPPSSFTQVLGGHSVRVSLRGDILGPSRTVSVAAAATFGLAASDNDEAEDDIDTVLCDERGFDAEDDAPSSTDASSVPSDADTMAPPSSSTVPSPSSEFFCVCGCDDCRSSSFSSSSGSGGPPMVPGVTVARPVDRRGVVYVVAASVAADEERVSNSDAGDGPTSAKDEVC